MIDGLTSQIVLVLIRPSGPQKMTKYSSEVSTCHPKRWFLFAGRQKETPTTRLTYELDLDDESKNEDFVRQCMINESDENKRNALKGSDIAPKHFSHLSDHERKESELGERSAVKIRTIYRITPNKTLLNYIPMSLVSFITLDTAEVYGSGTYVGRI